MLRSNLLVAFTATMLILTLFVDQEVSADPVPCDWLRRYHRRHPDSEVTPVKKDDADKEKKAKERKEKIDKLVKELEKLLAQE